MRFFALGLLAFAIIVLLHFMTSSPTAQDSQPLETAEEKKSLPLPDRLQRLVSRIRANKKLVGLAAVIMVDGKVIASAADGERKIGSGIPLEVGDKFHIGSITKSITATMLARLIERDILSWDTTVGDVFGDSLELHADWKNVTLQQLLTHTSGAPANFPFTSQLQHPPEGAERIKARLTFVAAVLKQKPSKLLGTAFVYSNVGPSIAGAMTEKLTGESWEDLIRQEVFVPLELAHAGFGPPQDNEAEFDQPRGHRLFLGSKQAVGLSDDNTPIIGPAGIVHMTLTELCTFGNEHRLGEKGNGKLLKAESYTRLHTPVLNNYAWGWVVPDKANWTDARFYWHNGSNTMWYALLVVLPEQNAVVAVAANDGDIPKAEAGAFQIVSELFGN